MYYRFETRGNIWNYLNKLQSRLRKKLPYGWTSRVDIIGFVEQDDRTHIIVYSEDEQDCLILSKMSKELIK